MPATLVLVHDAWHGPWAWRRLIEELPDVDVRTVALPSVGSDPAGLGDLRADVEAVRCAVAETAAPVLVCAHSYGGIPVTQALVGQSNVVGLVYVCAFQLDVGESLGGMVGPTTPYWWELHAAEGYVDPLYPKETFYGDVDGATAGDAVARLRHQSLMAFGQRITRAAWRTIPSTYVVCERDMALPVLAQEIMAERADRVLRMDTSHSPFLSRPAQLAGVLRAELAACRVPVAR